MKFFSFLILVLALSCLLGSCDKDPVDLPITVVAGLIDNSITTVCGEVIDTTVNSNFALVEGPVGQLQVTVTPYQRCQTQQRQLTVGVDAPIVDDVTNSAFVIGAPYDPLNAFRQLAVRPDYTYEITADFPGAESVLVEGGDLISFRNALSGLVNQIAEERRFNPILQISDAKIVYNSVEAFLRVQSKAKAVLGPDVRSFFQIGAGYSGTTYLVVRGMQTMNVITPVPTPSEILDASLLQDVTNCPAFLRTTTYGKLHIMLFESDSVGVDAQYQLKASVDALIASGSTEIEASAQAQLRSVRVRTLTLGGVDPYQLSEVAPALEADIPNFVINSSTWGKYDYGVPLGHHFVYLNGSPYRSLETTHYTTITCEQSYLYEDLRTCLAGSDPAHNYERKVSLTGNQVMTGIGIRVSDDGVKELVLQHRGLYADGTLGPRQSTSATDNENPVLELLWEAPDGYVVTAVGGGVRRDDFRTLKVTIAKPVVNEQGYLRMSQHRTILYGREPQEEMVEAFCSGYSPHQVVRGIEARVDDSNLKTWRTELGILP